MDLLDKFKNYLINNGYSEYTPSGNPSTVYDYIKRVQRVCDREKISINTLSVNIDEFVHKYDVGTEWQYGERSHRAVINALKRFEEFLQE